MRVSAPAAAASAAVGPRLLALLDAVAAATLVAPAVVGYWRGTWGLMDSCAAGWLPSLAVGITGHMLFALLQRCLANTCSCAPLRRLYTTVFGFCCVNSWRGVWNLLDWYTGVDVHAVLITTAIGVVALCISRTLRNISAPPFAIVTDVPEGFFDVPTMFRVSSWRDARVFVLDCMFSVLVVGTLVVVVWRGAWTLLDIYLFPDHGIWSAWSSLGVGYTVVMVTFSLQLPVTWVCARLNHLPRLLLADVYMLFSFCGTVNVWRGLWDLLDLYFLRGEARCTLSADTPVVSYWVSHVVCLLLLMLLNCSNSILVRGVYIDAEEDGVRCVVFPIHYLRILMQPQEPPQVVNHLVSAPLVGAPETAV